MILIPIVLCHATLIHFLAQRIVVPRTMAEGEFHSVAILLIPIVQPDPASPRPRSPKSPAVSVTPQFDPLEQDMPAQDVETTMAALPAARELRDARTDWAGAAAEADSRITQSRDREFGGTPRHDLPSEKKPLGVFERGPAHRAGDIEMFEDGVERRWVTSRCYRDFGGPPELLSHKYPGRLNLLRCSPGGGEVDGDLFDHLKPGYLKPKQ